MTHRLTLPSICRSVTYIYGPAILLHILKTIGWRNVVLRIMDQCDSKIDLVKYMWVSDLYFMIH